MSVMRIFDSKLSEPAGLPNGKPFGGQNGHSGGREMALLALSHTVVEHRLYTAMRGALADDGRETGPFGIRRLMGLTGMTSYSSIRRGCSGLVGKLSVEPAAERGPGSKRVFHVYGPAEIFERRQLAGMEPYPRILNGYEGSLVFDLVVEDLIARGDLGRREALVVLHCVEGLSNADIGGRLGISEKTVKFHMRHILLKYGIRRRTELLGRLLAGGRGNGRKPAGVTPPHSPAA
jgi:DNA-binding CsgD family transcriptional regulator